MSDDRERLKGELVDLFAAAAKRGRPIAKAAEAGAVSIRGDGNIIGNHNHVHVTVYLCARPCGCCP
ncbi:MAG: hypothetical protein IT479_02430 [Xanthomonadales bacterium]|nr:hypothetical protein [Xanthomonadales bacterium]MCC6592105.1 hypothetical protein [Xanthomonadales bacterium]MCE7932319.1 hypothetical protein [Xanthomonadales bacterium PRO6]